MPTRLSNRYRKYCVSLVTPNDDTRLQPAVLQRWQLGAHFGEIIQVDFGRDYTGTVWKFGDHLPPRINDY